MKLSGGLLAMGVVLVGSGCFFDSRMLQSRGVSAQQSAERHAAANLMPAPLAQPGPAHPGPVRLLKVRVWADATYRRRLHWREHVKDLFDRANGFLRHALAVELEPDLHAWDRDGDVPELDPFLEELAAMDPGEGVDHVLGLTGGLPKLVMSHEHIGRAWMAGKHFALRDMNDAIERSALAEAFPTLSRSELDELHAARTAHKEAAALIHEWAHNLGAMHEEGRELLMSPAYSQDARQLSEANLKVVSLSLAARAGEPGALESLKQFVATTDYDGWQRGDRDLLIEALDHDGLVRTRPPAAGSEAGASSAVGGAVGEALRAAEAHRTAGRWREAMAELDKARAKLGGDPAEWRNLGEAFATIGAYQRADEAFARAGTGPAVDAARAKALLWRRQRGVFGVRADDEPEANAAVEEVHRVLFDDDVRAMKMTTRGLARWPKLAGLLALRCGLELHAGHRRAAEQSCARALASSDETMLAHYFSGYVWAQSRPKVSIAHFERAIALDPDAHVAYEGLAPLYQAGGDEAKLAALRASYRTRFGKPLQ